MPSRKTPTDFDLLRVASVMRVPIAELSIDEEKKAVYHGVAKKYYVVHGVKVAELALST